METLLPLAEQIAILLKQRRETIAVSESCSGGLLSAALLAFPGASAYFLAGAVVYTHRARKRLLDIPAEAVEGMRSASEPYAPAPRVLAATDTPTAPGAHLPHHFRHGGRNRAGDHARNAQCRPGCQHARVRAGRPGTAAATLVAVTPQRHHPA